METLIPLHYSESDFIALWKVTGQASSKNKNILLTHGTFSNKKILKAISEYLLAHQYTCWIFEWRGHGSSSKTNEKYNFETIANEDFNLVFDYLFKECQINKIDCLTHSGGGISLTINLINYPKNKSKINRICFFGCQSFAVSTSKLSWLKFYLAKQLSRFLGYVPASFTGSEENESYYFMKQWFNWNLSGRFLAEDGSDFKSRMTEIQIPILSVCSSTDVIAPKYACKEYLNAFDNKMNVLLACDKTTGYSEDFNHSRLIQSRSAAKEIFPQVMDWFN